MSVLKNKGGQGGETIIAEGVKVEGDFTSQGNVVIDGNVSGNVSASGDIIIGERAHIDADVKAMNASISGTVKGSIKIEERLELLESACIEGDIEARIVSMAPGCQMNGKLTMPEAKRILEMKTSDAEPVEA
jgi:cytoskeletal protein CcmA (bactofilin family)